jgi:hypothetical protein
VGWQKRAEAYKYNILQLYYIIILQQLGAAGGQVAEMQGKAGMFGIWHAHFICQYWYRWYCQATWNVSQLILVHKRHLLKGYLWHLSRFLCRGYLCNWLFTFQVKLFTRTSEEPSLQDMNQAAWMTLHTLKYVRTNSREKALQIETNRDSSHNFVLKSSRCCSWFLLSLFWCWS